jgi:hypothetical protein
MQRVAYAGMGCYYVFEGEEGWYRKKSRKIVKLKI